MITRIPAIEDMPAISLAELTERAGLLTRVDRKYLVPTTQLQDLVAALPPSTLVLEIGGRRSFGYRSVYLDTPDLLAYRLTALRRRRRFKIRTRSYLDSDLHLLEVKTRGPRGTTVKVRAPYSGDGVVVDAPARAEAYAVLAASGAVTPDSPDDLQPTLITTYRRTTLFLPNSQSRVTIDTGLTWDLPEHPGLARTTARELDGYAVVETKSASTPAEMDKILWSHQFRPRSISKFGTGLALLRPDLPSHRWHPVLHRHLNPKELIS